MGRKLKLDNVSDDQLRLAVRDATSIMGVLRILGRREAGGSHSHFSRRIKSLGLDTSHHTGQAHNRGMPSINKREANSVLILRDSGRRQKPPLLRRALLEIGREHKCEKCGQMPDWLGNPLTLDVDHINEDWLDDRAENLRFLCPNCHSQFSRGLLNKRMTPTGKTLKVPVPRVPHKKKESVKVERKRSVTIPDEDLKNLVWSQPLREAAKRFNISDVGLKKECKRRDIETPPVGHWIQRENKR